MRPWREATNHPERADALVNEARVLLTGSNESGSFAGRYAAMMERVPSIAAAHKHQQGVCSVSPR